MTNWKQVKVYYNYYLRLCFDKVNVEYIISIYDTNVTEFTDKKLISILQLLYNYLLEKRNIFSKTINFDIEFKQKLNRLNSLKNSKIGYNCKLTNIKDILEKLIICQKR